MKIPRRIAQTLRNSLKGGVVPRVGLQYVTVGRAPEIDALLRDVEIIADGKHLPPELINMIVNIKGRDHVALITDSLSAAGLSITEGVMDGSPFIVEDGVCKLPDRSAFAGSIALPDRLLRTATKECGISMVDAVYMLTATPARILGLPKGRLEAGLEADIVVFDDGISIKALFSKGIQRI